MFPGRAAVERGSVKHHVGRLSEICKLAENQNYNIAIYAPSVTTHQVVLTNRSVQGTKTF